MSGGIDAPVELRGAVVQPAFAQPEAGVGVEGAVGVEALDLLGVSGAPDAERADAEFHVGFDFVNLGVQAFDEIIDVHPAPVFAVHVSLKCFPAGFIGKRRAVGGGVGVEVVVDVDAIHIVTTGDIEDDLQRMGGSGRFGGVQPLVAIVAAHELRMGAADVPGGGGALGGFVAGAIGVKPRVQFHAAPMGLTNGVGERIPERLRRLPHFTGKILAPRLQSGGIQCVAGGAHLKDQAVELQLSGGIDEVSEFFLLLGHG